MISRESALQALAEDTFDVLVIGGGVTGAGVALDAASRGLSVALVERGDYACGTSSRSSKMVHGGLRYLQNFDIALVREALIERRIMVELAPHLVWPTPFLVTAFEGERIDRKVGIGLNMYDVMQRGSASSRGQQKERAELAGMSWREYRRTQHKEWAPERHRVIDGEEISELVPALSGLEPKQAYLFYDCQTDDARLVLTILGEAERYGAVFANRVEVKSLSQPEGSVTGAHVVDAETAVEFSVTARHVVNATGVWADRLMPGAGDEDGGQGRGDEGADDKNGAGDEGPVIRPSRGTHITLRTEDFPLTGAALVMPAGEGRNIFALPWMGRTLVGTTDNDYEADDLSHIPSSDEDVEYLLNAVNEYLGKDLKPGDLTGAYAGVRPLISKADAKKSADISRKAELYQSDNGLITITGGKLTTWRPMAESVVDVIVAREKREAPSRTEEIPLGQPMRREDIPDFADIDEDTRHLLVLRYGSFATQVAMLARADERLAQRIVPDMPDRLAEVAVAARSEQARSIGDVLLRRTRLGLLCAHDLVNATGPTPAVERVAEVMAQELGWDEDRRAAEMDAWAREARAEGILLAV